MATGDIFVELGGNNASITLQPLGTAAIMVTSLANNVGVGSEPPVEIPMGPTMHLSLNRVHRPVVCKVQKFSEITQIIFLFQQVVREPTIALLELKSHKRQKGKKTQSEIYY